MVVCWSSQMISHIKMGLFTKGVSGSIASVGTLLNVACPTFSHSSTS